MNVLLLTIDALRWDYLPQMEWFYPWAQENAVIFDNHYSVAHCSDPNYLTMLSGRVPDNHSVFTQVTKDDDQARNVWPGYPSFPSLAAWLKRRCGHRTGAYTATFPQFYWYALDEVTPMGRNVKTKPGWKQVKRFMGMGEPWYFFIRTMDCHAPYRNGTYANAVRVTDRLVKDLVSHVLDRYPDTLVVFCSDHGEALGEHGMHGHWSTLYQALIHAPMVMYWPGCPGGLLASEFTQHQDIFPTVAHLMGGYDTSLAMDLDGWPMTLALQGETMREQMTFVGYGVFQEAYQQHRALIQWPWKYIVKAHIKDGPSFELYNLEADYWELNNKADKLPQKVQKMADALSKTSPMAEAFVRPDTVDQWDLGLTEDDALVIMDRLAALGYAG